MWESLVVELQTFKFQLNNFLSLFLFSENLFVNLLAILSST